MAKTAGVVSIDGADYDMASGRVVGSIKRSGKAKDLPTASQVIDGFIKRSYRPQPAKVKAKITGAKLITSSRVIKSKSHAKMEPASAIHHRAQHSKTLNRRGLARPKLAVKSASRTLANPAASLHKVVDPVKLARAKVVARSDKIAHFAKGRPVSTVASKKAENGEVVSRSNQTISHKAQAASAGALVASTSHQRLERMLDIALARADAHKRATQNGRSWRRLWLGSRRLSIALIILVVLIVALFFMWRQIPAVAIKVADIRAHVPATLPSYTPAGYSYSGPLSYGAGKVTLVYKDKANASHAFSLSQQKSDWDSTTLQNSINSSKSQVQSSQAGGLTVYIYNGSSSAAWVNNGMLYSIQNKANLSSDQILNIAQSL